MAIHSVQEQDAIKRIDAGDYESLGNLVKLMWLCKQSIHVDSEPSVSNSLIRLFTLVVYCVLTASVESVAQVDRWVQYFPSSCSCVDDPMNAMLIKCRIINKFPNLMSVEGRIVLVTLVIGEGYCDSEQVCTFEDDIRLSLVRISKSVELRGFAAEADDLFCSELFVIALFLAGHC